MGRRSDHTRDEIHEMALQAAEEILVEEGADGLSARKIAARIGYTVGTLYLVFRNLDDLILQVNLRTLEALHAEAVRTVQTDRPPAEGIRALGRAYIEFAMRNTRRWSLIFEHRLPEGQALPDAHHQRIRAMFGLMGTLLGELRPGLDTDGAGEAAHALWGGVHGICVLALTGKLDVAGEASVYRLADGLITSFLRGLPDGDAVPA